MSFVNTSKFWKSDFAVFGGFFSTVPNKLLVLSEGPSWKEGLVPVMSLSSHFSSFFFSFKIFWNDNWWWFYKQKNWKFPLIVWKEEFYVNFWRHQVKKIFSMGSLLMHPALLNVFVTNIIQVSVYFSLSSICIEKALLQNIDQELEIQQSKTLAKKK